jgi:hypothetical protein
VGKPIFSETKVLSDKNKFNQQSFIRASRIKVLASLPHSKEANKLQSSLENVN